MKKLKMILCVVLLLGGISSNVYAASCSKVRQKALNPVCSVEDNTLCQGSGVFCINWQDDGCAFIGRTPSSWCIHQEINGYFTPSTGCPGTYNYGDCSVLGGDCVAGAGDPFGCPGVYSKWTNC